MPIRRIWPTLPCPWASCNRCSSAKAPKRQAWILFADICKAGTIGSIHTTTVNADVQRLGDIPGDISGLLANRPTEVSIEGPQFGGGHGVFSYFVLKGLSGAADDNKDGVVDANELVAYVSSQVSKATSNRQHPREFGTYENNLKLSDA